MIYKKNLLSIGDFSKQTGVSIKSLRYYDEIGILPPAYVDPETNYRYYSFEQIAIVNVIKLCINLGIPLKKIKNFAVRKDNKINYEYLIQYGKELTQNSILEMQRKIRFLEAMEKDLSRINSYSFKETKIFEMPEKYCYAIPYQGNITNKDYKNILKSIFSKLTEQGYKIGYEFGILFRYSKNSKEQFIFLDVDNYEDYKPSEYILHIPSSKYICRKNKHSCINNAPTIFNEQFIESYTKIVIETWKYTGEFNTSDTFLEIRCSLP